MYYQRQLEKVLLETAKNFSCITLYGARQTGKSTMARNVFNSLEYVTLDDRRERELAQNNPEWKKTEKNKVFV